MHPKRTDGQPLHVVTMPDGRVFVDIKPEQTSTYGKLISRHVIGEITGRGGPDYRRHFCRFEDYGLADGLVRCRKCGLVKENDDSGKEAEVSVS